MKTSNENANSTWRLIIVPIVIIVTLAGCVPGRPQKSWQRQAAEKAYAELKGARDDIKRGAIRDYVKALLLLEKDQDPDRRFSQGRTLLMMAVIRNDKEMIKRLLSLDVYADVNLPDEDGNTPLIVACRKGYIDIAELLIKVGAQVNLQNKDETTALMVCAYCGYKDIALNLLRAGADRSLKDREGSTFVAYAKRKNHEDIIALINGFQP